MEIEQEFGGKISKFNEAALKMVRIHESQKRINFLRINMLSYDYTMNKYNYEIMVFELLSLYGEILGKLKPSEKEEGTEWRDKLLNDLEELPLRKKVWKYVDGKKQLWEITNRENWLKLRESIFAFEDFIKEMMESHGLSTMNEDDAPDWE